MINDQYFPMEANIMDDDKIYHLIDEMGLKSFGLYVIILTKLRRFDHYKCKLTSLKTISREYNVKFSTLTKLVTSYDLFEFEGEGDNIVISSVYLNRVMQKLDNRRKSHAKGGKAKDEIPLHTPEDESAGSEQPEENSKEENSKVENSKVEEEKLKKEEDSSPSDNIPNWENYINEAMNDEGWSDMQAKMSGMGLNFFSWKIEIFKFFKEHVLAQGTQERIHSLNEAKSYFANFIRRGTKTNEWVKSTLLELEEQAKKEDPYRFETLDPATGARSYFGVMIPQDAPPRPSFVAVWDKASECWNE